MAAQITARVVTINNNNVIAIGNGTTDAKGRHDGLVFGEKKAQTLIAWLMSFKTTEEAIKAIPSLTVPTAPVNPPRVETPAAPAKPAFVPPDKEAVKAELAKESRAIVSPPSTRPTFGPADPNKGIVDYNNHKHVYMHGMWFSWVGGKTQRWNKTRPSMAEKLSAHFRTAKPAPTPVNPPRTDTPVVKPAAAPKPVAVNMFEEKGVLYTLYSDNTWTSEQVPATA